MCMIRHENNIILKIGMEIGKHNKSMKTTWKWGLVWAWARHKYKHVRSWIGTTRHNLHHYIQIIVRRKN